MIATESMICKEFNDTFDMCYKGWDMLDGNGKSTQVIYDNGMEVIIKPSSRIEAEVWINGLKEEGNRFVVGYRNVLSISGGAGQETIRLPWGDVSSIKLLD